MPQSNSQRSIRCIPVVGYFAAPCESMNSKLCHGMAQHGMALHVQKLDTHTVSEFRARLQNSLSSVAFVFGP